ncbi:MAG: hypothetical protein EBX81_05080 [bacterium]|nr:hypothetical protein [Candidatus Aquidulcis sp.]
MEAEVPGGGLGGAFEAVAHGGHGLGVDGADEGQGVDAGATGGGAGGESEAGTDIADLLGAFAEVEDRDGRRDEAGIAAEEGARFGFEVKVTAKRWLTVKVVAGPEVSQGSWRIALPGDGLIAVLDEEVVEAEEMERGSTFGSGIIGDRDERRRGRVPVEDVVIEQRGVRALEAEGRLALKADEEVVTDHEASGGVGWVVVAGIAGVLMARLHRHVGVAAADGRPEDVVFPEDVEAPAFAIDERVALVSVLKSSFTRPSPALPTPKTERKSKPSTVTSSTWSQCKARPPFSTKTLVCTGPFSETMRRWDFGRTDSR